MKDPAVEDKLGEVLDDLKLDAVKSEEGFAGEAPVSSRLESIQLPG